MMQCYCKRLNSEKLVKRPPNAFILFRKSFSQLLKDANVFDRTSHANLAGGLDPANLEKFGVHTSEELIRTVGSCLSYPDYERFKSIEVSRCVSLKWNALPDKTKRYWFGLAKRERELHRQNFPQYKFSPVRNKVNRRGSTSAICHRGPTRFKDPRPRSLSAGSEDPSCLEETAFELCDFCKLKMEQEPQVTRSQGWNKRYYVLETATIDIAVLKKNLGVTQKSSMESVTDLCNNMFYESWKQTHGGWQVEGHKQQLETQTTHVGRRTRANQLLQL